MPDLLIEVGCEELPASACREIIEQAPGLVAGAAFAQHGHHGGTAPYAGQQARAIASLSDEDVAELRRGVTLFQRAVECFSLPAQKHRADFEL